MSLSVYPIKVSAQFIKNYTYLLVNELNNKAIVIDPSWQPEKIEEKLKETGATLTAFLTTHSHFDHANLDETLIKKYQPKIIISKIEANYYNFEYPNAILIEQETEIELAGIKVKPILTPGHTKGSLCYLIDKNLFTGDTLFIEGCGLCHSKGGSAETLYQSLCLLKETIHENTKIYPGHSYGRTPGKPFKFVLNNNIYLNFNTSEDFVTYRMRKNQSKLFNFK